MLQVETVEKFLTAEHKVAPVANTSLIEIQIGPLAFLGRSIKYKMKPTYPAHPEFFLCLMFGVCGPAQGALGGQAFFRSRIQSIRPPTVECSIRKV